MFLFIYLFKNVQEMMANLQIQIYIITGVFGSLLLLLILGLLYLTLLLRRLVVSSKSALRFLAPSSSSSSWAFSTSPSSSGV